MAATVTLQGEGGGFTDRKRIGNAGDRQVEGDYIFNLGTYATSGVALPSSLVGSSGTFAEINAIQFIPTSTTYYAIYDAASGLVLAYTRSNDTEVSNGTDLSAVEFYAVVKGLQ